jgi:hypothetical protein
MANSSPLARRLEGVAYGAMLSGPLASRQVMDGFNPDDHMPRTVRRQQNVTFW